MASSIESTKVLCVVCSKGKGIYKCEGCSRIFCPQHSIDHRNELNKQLEEVAVTHDLFQQTLNEQEEDPQQHPLLKNINEWEKESIVKVRETAEKARNELLKGATQHIAQVKEKLKILSNELKQGREENDFSEIDLRQWTQKLEELKKELLYPANITTQEDCTPPVTYVRIDRPDTSDVFERVCGTAHIKENGRLVVKDDLRGHTEIRGQGEYKAGRHIFRFQVEELAENGWIFFGIVSKLQSMDITSFFSRLNYGWSNQNQTYIGGKFNSGETIAIAQNDIILLFIDCDQRTIELKGEQTSRAMRMSIDINRCPFPWQLHLNLEESNTRVRILDPFV